MEQTTFAALLSLMDTWITDPECVEKPRVILAKSCISKYPHMDSRQIEGLKLLITMRKPNPEVVVEDIIDFCTAIGFRYSVTPTAGPDVPVKTVKAPPAAPRVHATAVKPPPADPRVHATAAKAPTVPVSARILQVFTYLCGILVSLWRAVADFGARTWGKCVDQGRASWDKVQKGERHHTADCICIILICVAALLLVCFYRDVIWEFVLGVVCTVSEAFFGVVCTVFEAFFGFVCVILDAFKGGAVWFLDGCVRICETISGAGYNACGSLYRAVGCIPAVLGRVCDTCFLSPALAFMQMFQRAANASSFATGGTVPIEGIAVNTSSLATGQCQCQGADRGDFVNSAELGELRAMVVQLASKLRDHEFVNHTPPQQLGAANASTVGTDLEVTVDPSAKTVENRLAACEAGNYRQDAQIAGLQVTVSNFSVELEKQINVSSILNETILHNLNDAHGWFAKFQRIGVFVALCLLGIAWGLSWVQKAPFVGEICRALGYTGGARGVFEPVIEGCMGGGLFCLMAVGLVSMVCWA